MTKSGNSLNNSDRTKIKILFNRGLSANAIGTELGFTEYVIRKELNKVGLISCFISKKDEITAIHMDDLAKETYGLNIGDNVVIENNLKDSKDKRPNDVFENDVIKGTVISSNKFYFVILTEFGYKTAISKADIYCKFKKISKIQSKKRGMKNAS